MGNIERHSPLPTPNSYELPIRRKNFSLAACGDALERASRSHAFDGFADIL
jgi:hypothetical protein